MIAWIKEIIHKDNVTGLFAIAGLIIITVSGHMNGLNGELTMAALATLGTYAAIKKK